MNATDLNTRLKDLMDGLSVKVGSPSASSTLSGFSIGAWVPVVRSVNDGLCATMGLLAESQQAVWALSSALRDPSCEQEQDIAAKHLYITCKFFSP